MKLEDKQAIRLFFTDETGFNLVPNIPYGWQPIGEQKTIRSAKALKEALHHIITNYDALFSINLSKNFFKSN